MKQRVKSHFGGYKADGYDDPSADNTSNRYSYRWHFRLITYDVPSDSCTVIINYSY